MALGRIKRSLPIALSGVLFAIVVVAGCHKAPPPLPAQAQIVPGVHKVKGAKRGMKGY